MNALARLVLQGRIFYLCLFAVCLPCFTKAQNVGIGITSPTSKLHVGNGAVRIEGLANPGTGNYTLSLGGYGSVMVDAFGDPGGRLTVTEGGQVGIGTSSPEATLDVRRGNSFGGTAQFWGTGYISHFNYGTEEHTYLRAGKINGFLILNDIMGGRVGVGVSNPEQALSVGNGMNIDHYGQNIGALDQNVLRFGGGFSGEAISSPRTSGSNNQYGLDFYTASAKRMVITNGGNVGISITNPSEKLQVNGNIKADSYKYTTTKTFYHSISSIEFSAIQSQYIVVKDGSGAFISGSAPDWVSLVAPVHLPHGAVIASITFDFDDLSVPQIIVATFSRQTNQSSTILTAVTTSVSSGYVSQTIVYNETINNQLYAYFVSVNPTNGPWIGSLNIHRVMIQYTMTEAQ